MAWRVPLCSSIMKGKVQHAATYMCYLCREWCLSTMPRPRPNGAGGLSCGGRGTQPVIERGGHQVREFRKILVAFCNFAAGAGYQEQGHPKLLS